MLHRELQDFTFAMLRFSLDLLQFFISPYSFPFELECLLHAIVPSDYITFFVVTEVQSYEFALSLKRTLT